MGGMRPTCDFGARPPKPGVSAQTEFRTCGSYTKLAI